MARCVDNECRLAYTRSRSTSVLLSIVAATDMLVASMLGRSWHSAIETVKVCLS